MPCSRKRSRWNRSTKKPRASRWTTGLINTSPGNSRGVTCIRTTSRGWLGGGSSVFVEDAPQVAAVIALAAGIDEALELLDRDEVLDEGDLLDTGNLQP